MIVVDTYVDRLGHGIYLRSRIPGASKRRHVERERTQICRRSFLLDRIDCGLNPGSKVGQRENAKSGSASKRTFRSFGHRGSPASHTVRSHEPSRRPRYRAKRLRRVDGLNDCGTKGEAISLLES